MAALTTPKSERSGLTRDQVALAVGEINTSLMAIERLAVLMSGSVNADDQSALSWAIEGLAQRAGMISDEVILASGGTQFKGDVWEWTMPPNFFPDREGN